MEAATWLSKYPPEEHTNLLNDRFLNTLRWIVVGVVLLLNSKIFNIAVLECQLTYSSTFSLSAFVERIFPSVWSADGTAVVWEASNVGCFRCRGIWPSRRAVSVAWPSSCLSFWITSCTCPTSIGSCCRHRVMLSALWEAPVSTHLMAL